MNYRWRGAIHNTEVNSLHAAAFDTRVHCDSAWNWVGLTEKYSLGWVIARRQDKLLGFVNVLWDGLVHAWLQDLMVAPDERGQWIGVGLVHGARDGAARAGCDYLHVDFDPALKPFYLGARGFEETSAGLMALRT